MFPEKGNSQGRFIEMYCFQGPNCKTAIKLFLPRKQKEEKMLILAFLKQFILQRNLIYPSIYKHIFIYSHTQQHQNQGVVALVSWETKLTFLLQVRKGWNSVFHPEGNIVPLNHTMNNSSTSASRPPLGKPKIPIFPLLRQIWLQEKCNTFFHIP